MDMKYWLRTLGLIGVGGGRGHSDSNANKTVIVMLISIKAVRGTLGEVCWDCG